MDVTVLYRQWSTGFCNELCHHNQWRRLNSIPYGRTADALDSVWRAGARDCCYASRSFMQSRRGLFWVMSMLIEYGNKFYRISGLKNIIEKMFLMKWAHQDKKKRRSCQIFSWFIVFDQFVFQFYISQVLMH